MIVPEGFPQDDGGKARHYLFKCLSADGICGVRMAGRRMGSLGNGLVELGQGPWVSH